MAYIAGTVRLQEGFRQRASLGGSSWELKGIWKVHSTWAAPDIEYEQAVLAFVDGALDVRESEAFLSVVLPFERRRARLGTSQRNQQLHPRCTAFFVEATLPLVGRERCTACAARRFAAQNLFVASTMRLRPSSDRRDFGGTGSTCFVSTGTFVSAPFFGRLRPCFTGIDATSTSCKSDNATALYDAGRSSLPDQAPQSVPWRQYHSRLSPRLK